MTAQLDFSAKCAGEISSQVEKSAKKSVVRFRLNNGTNEVSNLLRILRRSWRPHGTRVIEVQVGEPGDTTQKNKARNSRSTQQFFSGPVRQILQNDGRQMRRIVQHGVLRRNGASLSDGMVYEVEVEDVRPCLGGNWTRSGHWPNTRRWRAFPTPAGHCSASPASGFVGGRKMCGRRPINLWPFRQSPP